MKTLILVRGEEKKHSVIYEPEAGTKPVDDVFGKVYVRRESGLTHLPKIKVTVEEAR